MTIEDMPTTRVRGALPPGQARSIFTLDPDHVGIETCRRHHGPDRLVAPPDRSRRWLLRQSVPYRYVWPSELDLMAKIIRFPGPGPDRTLFTSASRSQVVFEKLS